MARPGCLCSFEGSRPRYALATSFGEGAPPGPLPLAASSAP
jgi:hypothetical protein